MVNHGWSAGMTIIGKVSKTAKVAILGAGLLMAAPVAANAVVYSVNFQGATMTVTPIDATHFTFQIQGSNALTGDWAGASYLGAFAFSTATVGATAATATLIDPATGQVTQSIPGGLNAGGCDGAGAFFCFNLSPNVAVAPNLLFNVTATAGTFSFAPGGPDLKIDWTTSATDDTHVGSLYSAQIPVGTPPVPEPATWAMMIVGFGLVGAGLRMRRKQALLAA